jgi:hypothetical protein
MSVSFIDFYIGFPGHPKFRDKKIIEDDVIRVIVQKYEMIIFTNKGDLLGDLDFGADLPRLLHQTMVSGETVEKEIIKQIYKYIPEISEINFSLKVKFFQDPYSFQDRMEINFELRDYEVYAIIS